MSISKTATHCRRQAAEAKNQAAQIFNPHLKAVYLRIAHQWSILARSYEFVDSAEHFLLDAKRTKDANAGQSSGELVLLPPSLVSREAHSARSVICGTKRLVPDGPRAKPGAAAA